MKQHQQGNAQEFESNRLFIMEQAKGQLSAHIESCEARLNEFANMFPQHLDQLSRQLEMERHLVLGQISRTTFGFIWPSRAKVMLRLVSEWFDSAAASIALEKVRYRNLPNQNLQERLAEIKRFLEQYQFELKQLDKGIRKVVD